MAAHDLDRAARLGNIHDILDFVTAGLAVVPRPDIEAVELRARAAGLPDTRIVLARPQAMALAALLISATATVDRGADQ